MKGNFTNFLILWLFISLFSFNKAADTCPSGMRKTFLDDQTALAYGVARNEIPALTFYEGNGALWYSRRVLISPRFEIHLKVGLNKVNVIESTDELILEGFTMVISGLNNKASSATAENIGYGGFSKSIIMEFDFNKNSYDPDSSSYSFKACTSGCTGDDSRAIYKGKLTSQRFDPTKNMNWDFRLVYNENKIKVYSGPNDLLYEYSVDLIDVFGGPLAYVGFTGYQRGNRRELNVLGTFICEDNYDLTRMQGSFVVDGKKLTTATYKAGNKVYYAFSFINNRGQYVPHCYKTNVWTYEISVSIDCQTSYGISVVDDYTLLITLDACPEIGRHAIGIKEANHGTAPKSYYDTIPNGLEKITLIGHDGIITDIDQQIDVSNGARILKYGSANGDFPYKTGLTFVLDFDMTDSIGNKVKIGDSSSIMLSKSELTLANAKSSQYSMKEYNGHYQFIFKVSSPGVYQIPQNQFMEESYEVKVVEGEVDNVKSYCTLDGYSSSPTIQKGDKVTLSCFLSDSFGNEISYNKFRDNSNYEFSCNVQRTSPGIATISSTPKEKDGHFACDYTANEAGEYKFKGYLNKKKSTTKLEITPYINSFSVKNTDLSLIGAKIYNHYSSTWQFIDDAILTYKADCTAFITALDLTDSTHTTLMSSLGSLNGVDISAVGVTLSSPHDPEFKFEKLKTAIVSMNGKQYIGVYITTNKCTDLVINKSSFDYRLQFTLKSEKKNVPYIYKFAQPHTIGNYITCFHKLDVQKTIVDFDVISLSRSSSMTFLGTIKLQTVDNYLYNYDIGKENIVLKSKGIALGFNYKVELDTIYGIYKIYASTLFDLNADIDLYVDGFLIKTFKTSSLRSNKACSMRLLEPSYVRFVRDPDIYNYWYEWVGPLMSSGNLRFSFYLYDKYKNVITENSFDNTYTDIYCHSYGADSTKYRRVTYQSETQTYLFEDLITQYGKYEWVIFARDCNNKTIISYEKGKGGVEVNIDKSYYTLVKNVIYEGEYAYVDVFLRDVNGQNIGQNYEALKNAQKSVIVKAQGDKEINMEFEQITGQLSLRYKYKFDKQGQYIITAKYDGKALPSDNKMLTVKSNGIDLDASIVQMIIDRTIDLSVDREETVDNNIHVPFYRLILYSVEGEKLAYDKSLDVTAVFSDPNGGKWDLLVNKDNSLYIQFTHDTNTKKEYSKFKRDHYLLTVKVAGKSKVYKIYLLGNGDDGSNAKDYDNDKTEYSTLHIYGEAGVTYPVNVEFRDKDGWRWGSEVDPTLFTVKNSYDLKSDKLSVIFQSGGKSGQFIININQKIITKPDNDNYLTIAYKGKELNKKIALTIYSSKLFKLKYDSGLRDGTVEDLPIIKLIPVDKYDNICQDIFDSSKTNQAKIDSLTFGKSLDGVLLETHNYLSDNKYLNVQYKTTVPTTIQVTSTYYNEKPDLIYKILPGDIDPDKTFAQLFTSGANTAGGTYVIMIYPRDKNGNEINNLTPEDLAKFDVFYDINGEGKNVISETCELVEDKSNSIDVEILRRLVTDEKNYNRIKCSTPITKAGTIEFHVEHVGDEVECRFCKVSIVANKIDFKKTKTIYVNKNYVMDEEKDNPTESQILPTWKLLFYDTYGNEIHDSEVTEKIDVFSYLDNRDIKLCVSDASYTKLINVCPDENGDDNQNKWFFLSEHEYLRVYRFDDAESAYLDVYDIETEKDNDYRIEINKENPVGVFTEKTPFVVFIGNTFDVYAFDNTQTNSWFYCSFDSDKNQVVTMNYKNSLDSSYSPGKKVVAKFTATQAGLTKVTYKQKSFYIKVKANEEGTNKIYINTVLGEREKDKVNENLNGGYNGNTSKNPYILYVGDSVELTSYSNNGDAWFYLDNGNTKISMNNNGPDYGRFESVGTDYKFIYKTKITGKQVGETVAYINGIKFYISVRNDSTKLDHADIEISDGGYYEFRTEEIITYDGLRKVTIERYDTQVTGVNHCYIFNSKGTKVVEFKRSDYQKWGTQGSTQYELTSKFSGKRYYRKDADHAEFDVSLTLYPSTRTETIYNAAGVRIGDSTITNIAGEAPLTVLNAVFNLEHQSVVDAHNKCPDHSGLDFNVASSLNKVVTNIEFDAKKQYKEVEKHELAIETLGYKLLMLGNENNKCKSGEVDISKTTFNPNSLTLLAGEEGAVTMTLFTKDGDCWNYWYGNINDVIKVSFDEDKDTCKSRVEKGEVPSQYKITVSCTKKNDENRFKVTINGNDVPTKVPLIIKPGYSYYLEPLKPELFNINDKTFVFKTNPTNDDTVQFNFKLLDKYRNLLDYPTLPETHTDVASELFGKKNDVYNAFYDNETESYDFTDKSTTPQIKNSWYFTCLESGNRYTFTYTKVPGKVDPSKSSYTVDKLLYIIKDTSYVEVTLRDSHSINVGEEEGRLIKEKEFVTVKTAGPLNALYEFDSITDHKTIKYKYTYGAVGTYDISVLYNTDFIPPQKTTIKVVYPDISLEKSKLYINRNNKELLMSINSPTTVNNTVEYPFFRFELYTKDGERILNYDKSTNFTCVMRSGDIVWPLTTTKNDDHVRFDYQVSKEEYANLPKGEYPLDVYVNGELKGYKLFLLGSDATDGYSPDPRYNILKAEVDPSYINGIVGNKYTVKVQLKANDGLNWNYYPNPNLVKISNSYGLNSKNFYTTIEIPKEKGVFYIHFIQKKVSTPSNPNRMSISYNGEKIPTEVEIVMKHGDLKKLVYVDGLRNGTIEDYPTLRFIPKDEFDNIVTDVFDPNVYDHDKLQKLTKGTSVEGYDLGSNNFVTENKYLNVQYQSTKPTTIKVTSDYFPETYKYTLFAGQVDPDKTYAELIQKDNPYAGQIQDIMIYPRDKLGNFVESLTENEKNKFVVTYTTPDNQRIDISNTCKITDAYKEVIPPVPVYVPPRRRLASSEKLYNKIQCSSPVTVAGSIQFHVDYVDDPVECRKCLLNITPHSIRFLTSLYQNTNVNMSRTIPTKVTAKELPTFVLTFYDQYWNKITNEDMVNKLDIETAMKGSDVDLCVSDFSYHKLSNVCSKDQENVNKWFYVVDGDFYKFVVTLKEEKFIFPVEIIDGYKSGSPDPLDNDKIYLNPTKLVLQAGAEGKINMELRTAQEERKNYWFKDHNEMIKIKFKEDEKFCSYNVTRGQEPGQYVIKVRCTKKRDDNKVTVFVEGKEVPQKVDLKIIAGDPFSSKLFTLDDVEIVAPDLGKVPVTEELKIKEIFYDRYDNLITPITFDTNTLGIKFVPTIAKKPDSKIKVDLNVQEGAVIIVMKSTLAGKHKLTGVFFPLPEYFVTFIHGPPSDKSILDVDKTVITAGEPVKAFITPYDIYGNRIDAHEFETSNPFTVYYRPEGENKDINVPKFEIEDMEDGSVISYPLTLTKAGVTKVSGFVNDSPLNTRDITVLPGDMDFLKSKVYRYNPNLKQFEILVNGTVEKNNETDPIYRLFPVDKYGNDIEFIPEEKLKKLVSYLNSQAEKGVFYYFKLNNKDTKDQGFAEFVKNDEDSRNKNSYRTLVGGFYDLIFSDGKDKLPYNITLGNSKEGSNLPEDIQNTLVFPNKIQIKAGEEGNVFVQIRTSENTTKSVWDGYSIKIESCDKTDKTFKYVEQGAGSIGTFLVTVTSQKANTYPTIQECPLNVYVNDVLVQNQHPLFEVYADEPFRSEILEKYWKEPTSSKVLKDGTADSNYVFEVRSFDKYGNLCETNQEKVGISVSLLGDNVKTVSDNVPTTGYRKYTVTTTVAGVYTITSKINSATNKQYLPNDSIFNIYPGEIDLSKVIVQERANVIKAGEKPEISIIAFDKNGNRIDGVNLQDKFNVIFTDAGSNKHETTNAVNTDNKDQVIYTSATPVTVIGYTRPTVTYKANSQKIDTSHINILVIAGDPDPKNSKLSRKTSSGTVTVYKNGDRIPCNVNLPPVFNITLYDKYNNYISTIPSGVDVIDPTMSGKSMTPIVFNVENKISFFNLDFNQDDKSLKIYSRLVKGDYDFTYDVTTESDKANFKYTIVLESDGDEKHGNGDIDKLIITPNNKTFFAGEYDYFTLEIRTKEGLLYNDEVDVNDIIIKLNKDEKSFKYVINPTGILGNYTISVYCEKKGEYDFDAQLDKKKSNVAHFKIKPQLLPYTPYTQILTRPPESIYPNDTIEITFKLADKFNNTFEDRDDIIDNDYLVVMNNNQSVPAAKKDLSEDNNNDDIFKLTLDPVYPPLTMNINSIYNDGIHTIPCFPEDIVVKIITNLELDKTDVQSRNAITIYVGDILDMRLYTFDNLGYCKEEEDYSPKFKVVVKGPLDTKNEFEKVYKVRKVKNDETPDACQNKYEIITTDDDIYTLSGLYDIDVFGDDKVIAHFDQTCYSGNYERFTLEYVDKNFNPDAVIVGDTVDFIIRGYDKYGNMNNEPLKDKLNVTLTKNDELARYDMSSVEIINGEVTYHATVYTTGKLQMHLYYNDSEVLKVNDDEPLPIWTVLNGPCIALENNENFDLSNFTEEHTVTLNRYQYFGFKCYDEYKNEIDKGGEIFYPTVQYHDDFGHSTTIQSGVIDNGDGYYFVKFIPESYGKHVVNLNIERRNGPEKYGDEIILDLKGKTCPNGQTLCPNIDKCVTKLISCIVPENDCPDDKPFECTVNGKTSCVASQIDCDCPPGYYKCQSVISTEEKIVYWPGYCVPDDKKYMCPKGSESLTGCKKKGPTNYIAIDGKCRTSEIGKPPHQRVCPIGKVLCADLSCRDKYEQCETFDECPKNYFRCADQTCRESYASCPDLVTCKEEGKVVCNDGLCYDSELSCPSTPVCDQDIFTYLCGDNECSDKFQNCNRNIVCKIGESLCTDRVCRPKCE